MKKTFRGSGLVEIVIASAIIGSAVVALLTVAQFSLATLERNVRKAQGAYLAEEGLEVMRSLRDQSWNNISGLSTNQTYYLTFTSGTPASWGTTTIAAPAIYGIFTRKITAMDVYRDAATSDIVASGGVLDPKTRRVRSTVSWADSKGAQSFVLETYFSDVIQ